MARDAQDFRALRGELHVRLSEEARIPVSLDNQGVARPKPNERFFPDGSAKKVFTASKLERLFNVVAAAAPDLTSPPQRLAQEVERQQIHNYLAILIDSNGDLDALVAFTRRVVTGGEPLRPLPVEDPIYLTRLFED